MQAGLIRLVSRFIISLNAEGRRRAGRRYSVERRAPLTSHVDANHHANDGESAQICATDGPDRRQRCRSHTLAFETCPWISMLRASSAIPDESVQRSAFFQDGCACYSSFQCRSLILSLLVWPKSRSQIAICSDAYEDAIYAYLRTMPTQHGSV